MFIQQKQIFHWRRAVRNGREINSCKRLLAGIMLFAAATVGVEAAPTGGTVTSGQANIATGTNTTINQTTHRVDIDWTGFNTTQAESVTFNQPGSTALAVNRISGNRTSFDGTLNANGRIFLINQNGITFGSHAQVNTGALLATTSELDNSTSAPETHSFSGSGYGTIINDGNITVSDGGFAVLAAPYVENNGFIKADLGQVELASTNDFTIAVDLRGDGLITFDTSGEVLAGETSPLGAASNGTLQSKSGNVYLSANMASEIVEGVVNLSGVVDADQFVSTPGGIQMVASAALPGSYPGGNIKVESTGDINIGGGADIHAIGGETVTASFLADRNINTGASGDPATITLKAFAADDPLSGNSATRASAGLQMIAARKGGTGAVNVSDGVIEVTAEATGTAVTTAAATVILEGADADVNADFDVHARAESHDGGTATGSAKTDALAVLDVLADGEIEYDTSHNIISFGEPGDLTQTGNIDVSATATSVNAEDSKATANTLLAASGSSDVTSPVNVNAVATSRPGLNGYVSGGTDSADANAALAILGGTPQGLLLLAREVSLNRVSQLGTLSDILTLANLDDVLAVFGGLVQDPIGFLDSLGGVGNGSVSYTGDSNVNALADFNTNDSGQGNSHGLAEATAAGYFAAGGNTYINTDPVRVNSQANANYDTGSGTTPGSGSNVDTGARSFLAGVAGLHDLYAGSSGGTQTSTLTVRGALSTSALEQASLNGMANPDSYNQLAAAVTALIATGDITVRGADPLAAADPAQVQGRTSRWQLCYQNQCSPVTAGLDGVLDLAAASAAGGGIDSLHLAQLIIESLYGSIDIQPKNTTTTEVQPAGLFTDPIGPSWPGDLPLRFDSNGRMLAATGMDATRPPQIVALGSNTEEAILAGGDPSLLLPPTASGGCVAAGRDAFTVSGPDYFDRMISADCDAGN
jgi:filamentous hemagglutinin family protein